MAAIKTKHLEVNVLWEMAPVDGLKKVVVQLLQGLDDGLGGAVGMSLPSGTGLELGLHFVGDEKMSQLNSEHRQRLVTTDVLSFPLHENMAQALSQGLPVLGLGDVVVSVPRAREQALGYGISLPQEVAHLVAHGFLHLIGFDHQQGEEAAVMFDLEKQLVDNMYQACGWR